MSFKHRLYWKTEMVVVMMIAMIMKLTVMIMFRVFGCGR